MQLTLYTDYSLRVLLYLALQDEGATITEISERYGISRNHLVKIVHNLGRLGYIETSRGRGGGIRLAKSPEDIVLGGVVAAVEPHFHLVECFDPARNTCVIAPACQLKHVLFEAQRAFLSVLDGYSLADLAGNRKELLALFADGAATGRKSGNKKAEGAAS